MTSDGLYDQEQEQRRHVVKREPTGRAWACWDALASAVCRWGSSGRSPITMIFPGCRIDGAAAAVAAATAVFSPGRQVRGPRRPRPGVAGATTAHRAAPATGNIARAVSSPHRVRLRFRSPSSWQ